MILSHVSVVVVIVSGLLETRLDRTDLLVVLCCIMALEGGRRIMRS